MTHNTHPSIIELKKKKSVSTGKEAYLEQVLSDTEEASDKQYDVKPSAIEEERLKKFSHSGEKYFKILIDSIHIYKDKSFKISINDDFSFNKNDIIQGTFIDNKIVLFGAPYNVYCKSIDVEPIDIDHKTYLHQQKERESNQKNKNISIDKNIRNDIDDHKIAENDSDFEIKLDENTKLMDKNNKNNKNNKNKQKDPSLSDYALVNVKNEENKKYKKIENKKGYEAVDNDSDNEDSGGAIIIFKQKIWFKRYPYNKICLIFLFLLILILDILLIIFLTQLNESVNSINDTICDKDKLLLIYNGTYLIVTGIGLFGLIIFCLLLHFGSIIAEANMAKSMINGISFMMIILYLGISIWQMFIMKNEINSGIDGITEDIQCNIDGNSKYISDLQNIYGIIDVLIILKLVQAVVLVLVALSVVCMRSIRNDVK